MVMKEKKKNFAGCDAAMKRFSVYPLLLIIILGYGLLVLYKFLPYQTKRDKVRNDGAAKPVQETTSVQDTRLIHLKKDREKFGESGENISSIVQIVYGEVPKTGSTTFGHLFRSIAKENKVKWTVNPSYR